MKREPNKKCPKCNNGKLEKQYLPPNNGWPDGQRFLPGGALTGSRWTLKCDSCSYEEK